MTLNSAGADRIAAAIDAHGPAGFALAATRLRERAQLVVPGH
jgi:hypothetical protein